MFKLKRSPIHPGEILREEFINEINISQTELGKKLNVSFQAINELVNEKRGVSIEMAFKLSKAFGTSPEFWVNLQKKYDIYKVSSNVKKMKSIDNIEKIQLIEA